MSVTGGPTGAGDSDAPSRCPCDHVDDLGLDPDRLPRWANRRSVTIASGASIDYRADDWRDSMVIVTEGTIELEGHHGTVHRFDTGSILWCQDLPIRLIRATGLGAAVLQSISRRPRPP